MRCLGVDQHAKTTYQCVPSMFYGLCLIQKLVLYKQDMREEDIQAH